MKCKSHPYEQGVGVCASCLRERLLALIAAQNEHAATHHYHRRRRSDPPPPQPPPPVFPRSVSPYVSHRRSVGSDASPAHPRYQRFFSTPQLGPTFGVSAGGGGFGEIHGGRRRRFSIFKAPFGHHRSGEPEHGLGASKPSALGSWFSALIRGRRKKKKKKSHAEEPRRSRRAVERGMSPSMDDEDEDDDGGGGGGYSSDEYRRPTPTPMRRFPAGHRHHRSIGAVSGFSVCLSPLMRFGPDSRRSQGAEAGISGDHRSPADSIHHWNWPAAGAPFGPNRSRKLTELGKFE